MAKIGCMVAVFIALFYLAGSIRHASITKQYWWMTFLICGMVTGTVALVTETILLFFYNS